MTSVHPGWHEGRMAVEHMPHGWVLRARMPYDLPIHVNKRAAQAMAEWRQRNIEKFRSTEPA